MSLSERKAFPADLPEGLKPRLRLFLSVDLVGSTAFKQSRQEWLPAILNFYRDFDQIIHAQYRAFRQRSNAVMSAPELWKTNGDELLYVCELVTRAQAVDAIHIWLAALSAYRCDLATLTEELDVKSRAWIGLFPAPNSEVFFRRGGARFRSDTVDDPIVLQAEMRDAWYAGKGREDIIRDFVGPSIDTGFRLSLWATPRRMVLSADLAFLLSTSQKVEDEPLPLHFSGAQKLHGVMDNQPYPMIWLPVGAIPRADQDDGIGRHLSDPLLLRTYCEAIIEQNYKVFTPLFLADDPDDDGQFAWAPPFIINRIIHDWNVEKRHKLAA